MMFDKTKGFLIFKNLHVPEEQKSSQLGDLRFVDNGLHKFKNDEVLYQKENDVFWLDGFILNKNELMSDNKTWTECYVDMATDSSFPVELRGGFCGLIRRKDNLKIFCDHVGNRTLYYYANNNTLAISTRISYLIELLEYNGIKIDIDNQAVRYMVDQGFMLDDTTYVRQIKRVLPGEIVTIKNSGILKKKYYRIDNTKTCNKLTEEEAIKKIDKAFKKAIQREYEKDEEYGYQHLVDLSGGLDSRMNSFVAHKMGFVWQYHITYCKSGYLDFKIAQKIAKELKHRFFYMSLDDFRWFLDIDKNVELNNGAAYYVGITGGISLLETINADKFGIEHTGMVGDAILSTFYQNEAYNYGKASGRENAYSQKALYDVPDNVLNQYDNRELFSIYTRGLLGAQSSYFSRQNFVETYSPFLDVDFLNCIFEIPFKYRKKHYIYLKWIKQCYPEAAEYGWEKWNGIRPKESNRWKKKIGFMIRKCIPQKQQKNHMNPIDYWYQNDSEVQKKIDKYISENDIFLQYLEDDVKDGVIKCLNKDSVVQRAQALTVLAMLKRIYG